MKKYKLSNGWIVSKGNNEKAVLHVLPLDNSIFRMKQDIELPNEIFSTIEKGESDIKELFRKYKLHNLIFQWKEREAKPPSKLDTQIYHQGKGFLIQKEYSNYFMIYELSRQGGRNRKIPISKMISLSVKSEDYSVREILEKYNLYHLDTSENDI